MAEMTPAAPRSTHGRKLAKKPTPKPRAKSTRKKAPPSPSVGEIAALRAALESGRNELAAARLEIAEVVAACREAEARVAATRAEADAIRRTVAEVDSSAAAVRGVAEAAQAELNRTRDQSDQTEGRLERLRTWLQETRTNFAELEAEAHRTLDHFRGTVEALRSGTAPPGETDPNTPAAASLPEVPPLAPEERADDIRERLTHLLNAAWGVEKEQVGLLQTLADESGDRDVRVLLEEHRASARRRQEAVQSRLEALGVTPTGERGLLGQLATRIWDAVRAPRDQADRAVLSLLKAGSAAEFQAGLYAALHACGLLAGDTDTADLAAAHFGEQSGQAKRLRAALPATVGRAVRR